MSSLPRTIISSPTTPLAPAIPLPVRPIPPAYSEAMQERPAPRDGAPSATLPPFADPLTLIEGLAPEVERTLDAAARFLGVQLGEAATRRNKPVLLHSLRVGGHLAALGFREPVYVAGVLHDLIEVASVPVELIARRHGALTARLVLANTVDKRRGSWSSRFQDSLRRCRAEGPDALCVRAADVLDNARRHLLEGNRERLARQEAKLRLVIGALEPVAEEAPARALVEELEAAHRRLTGSRAGRRALDGTRG